MFKKKGKKEMAFSNSAALFAAIIMSANISLYIPAHVRLEEEKAEAAVAVATERNQRAVFKKVALSKLGEIKDKNEGMYYWLEEKSLPSGDISFKSYMDKDTITDKSSTQWDIVHDCWIDDSGFLHSNTHNEYVVAVAPYYGSVGDKLTVVIEGEKGDKIIECYVGDQKADAIGGMYHEVGDGRKNVVEFIVETSKMSRTTKLMGDCSYSNNLDGNIKAIYRWPEGQIME